MGDGLTRISRIYANMNLKRTIISLVISGVLLISSAISGIRSAVTHSGGWDITYWAHDSSRFLAFLFGMGFLYVAWHIRTRPRLGWQVAMMEFILGWMGFITGGTYAVVRQAGGEGDHTNKGLYYEFLFAGMLALVSAPVMIYHLRRLYKNRDNFDS
jgi:hypothetical protein